VRTITRFILLAAIAAAAMLLGACSRVGVDVWERDILALEEMQPSYATVDRALDDHIYFSKEAASGGRGFGGGGCGCN
jgi:hypothetical protein